MKTIHTSIHLGISAADCATTPVLILFPNSKELFIPISVVRYARYLQKEEQASYATITKDIHYIGLLFDYYYLIAVQKYETINDWEMFIEYFLTDFKKGAVLGWKSSSINNYIYCKNTIKQFGKFVFNGNSDRNLLPNEKRDVEEVINRSYQYSSHLRDGLLFHIKKNSSIVKEQYKNKKRGRKSDKAGAKIVKYFPPEYLPLLIEETTNIRDKILFLMAGYGGRRSSEIIQILVNDVEPVNGRLQVILAHPETSSMQWLNKAGKSCTGTRGEFLKTMYELKSRINMGGLSSFAGWKGMKYDDENAEKSYMWFIREEVEQYLLYLHIQYMREIRGQYSHHPYYFINGDGDPLSMRAMRKQLNLACKRIEKKYNINLDGLRWHSLRHHYGFYCADILNMDLLMIRKYIGHKQISSTAIYTHISPEKARQALQDAQDMAKLEGKIQIDTNERLLIQERFNKNSGVISTLPNSWKTSWLTGDELDTMLITR